MNVSTTLKKYLPTITVGVALALPAMAQGTLPNPLGNITNPNDVISNVIQVFLGVVGGIALLFFIYGGFMMLISGGSKDRVETGRKTLMWATVGLLVVFGSYGIVDAVFRAIQGDSIVG